MCARVCVCVCVGVCAGVRAWCVCVRTSFLPALGMTKRISQGKLGYTNPNITLNFRPELCVSELCVSESE